MMPTPRTLVTLLLLAAVGAVALIGVANWRQALEPGVASAVPAAISRSRPLLGYSASRWSPRPGQGRDTDGESFPTASPRPGAQPRRDSAANRGGRAGTDYAMMLTVNPSIPDEPPRRPARAPFGPFTGFGSDAAHSATPGSATTGGDLAVVEFIALTQDMQLLQQDSFMADAVRELKILVWWDVPGPQSQRLELFSPDGTLYKRSFVQFDGDAGRVPFGSSPGGRTPVETRLPVGGTWITEYSLFGPWRVDVYLAGQATPVTSAPFFLNH